MESMLFDVISWIGLTICIGAFFIKNIFWLRLTTLIGCSLLFIYYSYIDIPQGVISNLLVLLINAWYLLKVFKIQKTAAPQTEVLVTEAVTPAAAQPSLVSQSRSC
ncbi:hypothetical protein QE250_09595 [Chromatiaceae bacterium AAb-1]|nr:hypothetical protein [Chromatiaceae bacterium AAb-1]